MNRSHNKTNNIGILNWKIRVKFIMLFSIDFHFLSSREEANWPTQRMNKIKEQLAHLEGRWSPSRVSHSHIRRATQPTIQKEFKTWKTTWPHSSQHHSLNYLESHIDIRATSTQAKSRDHEIVRAQNTSKTWKCSKAIPTHLQNHEVWSRILKCNVKSYVTRPSTKCYFNEFLFIQVLTYDKIE